LAADTAHRGGLLAFLRRWPEGVVSHPWLIIVFWVVVAVVVVPGARNIESRLEVAARMPSEQAQAVHDDLQRRFRSPFTDRVLLVVEGVPLPTTSEGREALETIVRELRRTAGVAGTLSSLDTNDAIFAGKKGGFLVIVGLDAKGHPVEDLLPALRATTQELTARLKSSFPQVWLGWTGEMPLNYDLRIASASDARSAEIRVLPLTVLLLLLAFGGALAAILPVGIGLLSIALALGVAAWLAQFFTISIFIQTIASMIGLGLGIDYALLTVSRFRESFATRGASAEAAEDAARHAGWTILLSAFPVSIGFAALLTIPLSEQSSVGLAGLLVTLFALLLSVTLLPALLQLLGRRIDWLSFRRPSATRAASGSAAWRRWGARVTRWPVIALVLASTPLLVLALQARRLTTATPLGDWLPKGSESVTAYHALAGMGRENLIHSLRVVLDFPPGVHIDSEEGWSAAVRLFEKLRQDGRFERVQCLPAIFDRPDGLRFLPLLSPAVRRTLEASDGSAILFESIPKETLSPRDQVNLARELRKWNAAAITGLPGVKMSVGGRPAFDADYEDVVARHFRRVVLLVIGCTFLALFAGFRSLLVAIKAVILNLLSVGASFGALVLVFQEGWGVRLLGVDGPTGSVFPIIPVLVFCIVFGLSMDYEVILVARVAEARRGGMNESDAIAEGLSRTATVITSAAAIMIAVFAAFTIGKFLPIKMLGFALSVAVLIDAVAVRMVIGPALLRLAGRWNWWPGGLR
jgi:RND superfamily putative drug exporter